ncbi:MAG: helix-turn-helix transcriptional regulator [Planctomycetaceae bacterium]|nr:helix-turn-helix transcriptional regulator [Planctomycetaceae bacterium]
MIGDELRAAREAAGLTQEALAFKSGVDRSYVSQLERNLKSPTLEMLLRLCRNLGVKASELVAKVELEPPRGTRNSRR